MEMRNDKKDDFSLNVISGIDEEIIDRNLEKRFHLMEKIKEKTKKILTKKQKVWMFGGGGVAAAVLLAFLGIFLFSIFAKNIPVYTGMTVSKTAPTPIVASAIESGRYVYLNADTGTTSVSTETGETDPNAADMEEIVEDTLVVEGAAEQRYYAAANEDIYITIHIDNPDNYEILSFTLNGQKYSSYMFEEGSDMENLVLKVNVGDVKGIVEYTIDAIKYVDGTEIKDVRMEGDKTVSIGITSTPKPNVIVQNEVVGIHSYAVDVTVTDVEDLIGASNGKAAIVLRDCGTNEFKYYFVSINGTTSVKFEGLERNTLYERGIVLAYDDLRAGGFDFHISHREFFYTKDYFAFGSPEITQSSITFVPEWFSEVENKKLTSLALFRDGQKVRDLAVDATKVEDLEDGIVYSLVAMFTANGEEMSVEYEFKTELCFYTVLHYVENADDDEYTIRKEIKFAKAGTTVTASLRDSHSMKLMCEMPTELQTGVVKPDNSLTFEYYYPRLRYELSFVTNGGAPIEKTSVKVGQRLPTPVREGYEFESWYTDEQLTERVVTLYDPINQSRVYAAWVGETKPEVLEYEYYDESETSFKIVGCNFLLSAMGYTFNHVVLPAYIGGLPVVGIEASHDGYYSNSIHALTLCENIKSIGADDLRGLTNLRSLTIPASVESIEAGAFDSCNKLVEVCNLSACDLGFDPFIEIVNANDKRAEFATSGEDIFMLYGDTVYWVGGSSIILPETSPFENHPNYELYTGSYVVMDYYKTVTIPAAVTKIWPNAFQNASSLREVILENKENWVEVQVSADGTKVETDVDFASMTNTSIGRYFRERCSDGDQSDLEYTYYWYVKQP